MAIITIDDYNAIRGALDTSLDETGLPDAVIALPIYAPLAELMIAARDPLAATRTGTDAFHIKNAAIYMAASLIAPAIPAITQGMVSRGERFARTIDWDARSTYCLAMADEEIDAVLNPDDDDTADRPTAFAVAGSGRTWLPAWRVP